MKQQIGHAFDSRVYGPLIQKVMRIIGHGRQASGVVRCFTAITSSQPKEDPRHFLKEKEKIIGTRRCMICAECKSFRLPSQAKGGGYGLSAAIFWRFWGLRKD